MDRTAPNEGWKMGLRVLKTVAESGKMAYKQFYRPSEIRSRILTTPFHGSGSLLTSGRASRETPRAGRTGTGASVGIRHPGSDRISNSYWEPQYVPLKDPARH